MPRTVLIVDDERDTNDMLAAMVQTREFKPIQLFSGSQVLGAVREHEPEPMSDRRQAGQILSGSVRARRDRPCKRLQVDVALIRK